MSIREARAGAAFAVIAGSLVAQSGQVIGALGYALGVLLAPTWGLAVMAHVVGALLGCALTLAVTLGVLRHVDRSTEPPSLGVGILATGISVTSYVGATALGYVGGRAIQGRIEDWATDDTTVGDMVSNLTYATSGLSTLSGLFGLLLTIGSLAWLWSRGQAGR